MKKNYTSVLIIAIAVAISANCYAITDALKIKIAGNGYSDETIIRFITGATTGFDGSYDASKFFSSNPSVPGLYSKDSDARELSVNAMPILNSSITKEVFLKIGATGTYTISASEPGAFAANVKIIMKDVVTGQLYDLRTSVSYVIELPVISKTDAARFQVLFSYPVQIQSSYASCGNCTDGTATITKAGETGWGYSVIDSIGTTVKTGISSTSTQNIYGLSVGSYSVIITNNFSITETKLFTINVTKITTGISASVKNKISFSVFPMPAHDFLTIRLDHDSNSEATIIIRDITGREHYSEKITAVSGQQDITIDIREKLTPGMYIISLIEEGRLFEQKIIIY